MREVSLEEINGVSGGLSFGDWVLVAELVYAAGSGFAEGFAAGVKDGLAA